MQRSMRDDEEDADSSDRDYTHYDLFRQLKRNTKKSKARAGISSAGSNVPPADADGSHTSHQTAPAAPVELYRSQSTGNSKSCKQ